MSLGNCAQCGCEMRQTLASNQALLDAAKEMRQRFPDMKVSLKPRPGQRLLCDPCKSAGHSVEVSA